MPSAYQKRRGTAIVETDKGILVVSHNSLFLLPGGAARSDELQILAAIRELQEETGTYPEEVRYLFKHLNSKIFLMKIVGIPKPCSEITRIDYYIPGKDIPLSFNTKKIIDRYYAMKLKKL